MITKEIVDAKSTKRYTLNMTKYALILVCMVFAAIFHGLGGF